MITSVAGYPGLNSMSPAKTSHSKFSRERRCSGLFVLDCEYGLETTVGKMEIQG